MNKRSEAPDAQTSRRASPLLKSDGDEPGPMDWPSEPSPSLIEAFVDTQPGWYDETATARPPQA